MAQGLDLILMVVVMFGLMYLLVLRPAQRKMREQMTTQSAVGEGTRVVLTSGFFGTVRHAGDTQLVVEIAPDVLVTVMRQAVLRVVTADEEEFSVEAAGEEVDGIEPGPAQAEPASMTDPSDVGRTNENKDI